MSHTQSMIGLGDINALPATYSEGGSEHTPQPPALWALDPRLSRIAAQAAIDFDWLIHAPQENTDSYAW